MHLERETMSGFGMFKGQSLCLREIEIPHIHKKFYTLFFNRNEKEQEIKE